jgi:hypothetical protein
MITLTGNEFVASLTIRQWFAGMALQSFSMLNLDSTPEQTAVAAVAYADALIEELNKDTK